MRFCRSISAKCSGYWKKSQKPYLHMKHQILIILLIALTTGLNNTFAQNIQLLDVNTRQAIDGASWQYDGKTGITDSRGSLNIEYKADASLSISHLNYGAWQLTPAEVKKALETKTIFREETCHSLMPVTIVALHTPLSSQATLSLNTRDRLAHDGGDILNSIEGFSSIRKSGAYGSDPVFRGFKSDQLNIIINGAQTATAACPNRMDPPSSQVAPNMISHIEIQKGPHSLRYGNSFGATINYIPLAPRYSDKQRIYGRITGSFETNGEVIRNEGVVGISGKRYDLGIFGSFAKGSNYTDGDGNSVAARFSRASAGASLGIKISEKQNLNLSATRNFARDTDFPTLPMDLRSDDTWLLNARHNLNINRDVLKSWNTALYASLVDHKMDNLLKTIDPRMMNASTPANTRVFGGRTEGRWLSGNSGVFAGADLRIENASGERKREFIAGPNAGKVFFDNVWQNGTISKSAIFAEYQKTLTGITLIVSARLELNQSGINDEAVEFSNIYENTAETQLNPALSGGGVKNIGNNFSAGLWLGSAKRSGSMTERFINYFPVGQDAYELLGNPNIKPETNNQADFNLSYKTAKTIVSLDVFASVINHYISSVIDTNLTPRFPTSPGVRKYVNIDKAFKTGFEMSWKQSLTAHIQQRLSVAYTYGQNTEIKEPLPEIAPMDFRYSVSGSFFKDKLHPSISLRHVLMQQRTSAEFGENESPAFTLADITVSWKFSKVLSATAGVQNLFDVAYYEHLNRPVSGTTPKPIYAPGRNFSIAVTADLF
jgi:iron complex outermembrane receptor protein